MPRGLQTPRLENAPQSASSAGQDVIDFAAACGLHLDPWQQHVLLGALGERPDGKWQCSDVVLIVSRQNGKGAVLEALVLAWLFLFDEQQILFSAHEMKTAVEMFKRIRDLIKANAELDKQVANFYQSNERTAIVLTDDRECRFMARSNGSGRGFSAQKIVFDEAYNLPDSVHDAQKPTTGAMQNPQTWYTSSAGDKDIAPCDVLARMRRLGMGGDEHTALFEWSVPYDELTREIKGDREDPHLWAVANPSQGIRKRVETIAGFQRTMSEVGFNREELGVGNWPLDETHPWVIDREVWEGLSDFDSEPMDPVCFGVDVPPDRHRASIAVAGVRLDGLVHLEMVRSERERGTAWVPGRVLELVSKWKPCAVVLDAAGPAGSLIAPLTDLGVEVVTTTARDMAAACGGFYDDALERKLRYIKDARLDAALGSAKKRKLSGAWAWDRDGATDISPLVAATLARWGLTTRQQREPKEKAPSKSYAF